MKIAIISDYYYPQLGGITEHVHGQATELSRRGHEVTVITPRVRFAPDCIDEATPRGQTFNVEHVGRAWPLYGNASKTLNVVSPTLALELRKLYRRHRFDVVHVHSPTNPFLGPAAVMLSRARATVGTFHSVVNPGYRLLKIAAPGLTPVLKRLDARVAVSEAVPGALDPFFPGLDYRVIPNGIDTDFFSPDAEPLPHLVGDKRNILFLGRFDPRNGLNHMIHAFTDLRENRDDARLVIVGDGPARRVYERMVPRHLRDDVLFEGRANHLRPRYLASADLLCTPCELASFGMVLLEAMSCGVPAVANRISGFQLVMQDGVHGLMIHPPSNRDSMVTALGHVLDNPSDAARMGAAGRARAVSEYSWTKVGGQLETLYEELLGEGRAPRPPSREPASAATVG